MITCRKKPNLPEMFPLNISRTYCYPKSMTYVMLCFFVN
nr:MAG TPA: hypothetical protein [Myoviridae sp. ctEXz2]